MNAATVANVLPLSHAAVPAASPSTSASFDDLELDRHMALVHKLAQRVHAHIHGAVEMSELVSFGVTGLLEARRRYDANRGEAQFATFAYYRIRGAMLDGIGALAPLSRKSYRAARAANDHHVIYMDTGATDELADPRDIGNPEQMASQAQLRRLLQAAIERLPGKQKQLVQRHYWNDESLVDASTQIGISKSWGSRAHANALRTLRKEVEAALAA